MRLPVRSISRMATNLPKLPDITQLSPNVIRILGGNPSKVGVIYDLGQIGSGCQNLLKLTLYDLSARHSSPYKVRKSSRYVGNSFVLLPLSDLGSDTSSASGLTPLVLTLLPFRHQYIPAGLGFLSHLTRHRSRFRFISTASEASARRAESSYINMPSHALAS